jgi:hypothetical protein
MPRDCNSNSAIRRPLALSDGALKSESTCQSSLRAKFAPTGPGLIPVGSQAAARPAAPSLWLPVRSGREAGFKACHGTGHFNSPVSPGYKQALWGDHGPAGTPGPLELERFCRTWRHSTVACPVILHYGQARYITRPKSRSMSLRLGVLHKAASRSSSLPALMLPGP